MISQSCCIILLLALSSLEYVHEFSYKEVSESLHGQLIPMSPQCFASGLWLLVF